MKCWIWRSWIACGTPSMAAAIFANSCSFWEPPLPLSGDADRYDHRIGNDDYSQPGALFRLVSPDPLCGQILVRSNGL